MPDKHTAGEGRGAVGADHVGAAATAAHIEGQDGEANDGRHHDGTAHQAKTRTDRLAGHAEFRQLAVRHRRAHADQRDERERRGNQHERLGGMRACMIEQELSGHRP